MNAKPKVFIAIPVYGWVPVDFMQCLMRIQANPPCNVVIRTLNGDSLVSRARNTLTAEFLKTDCTHLLFLDSDLIFSGDQIKRLISHNKDVVAGFYPKKQDGPVNWVCNAKFEPNQANRRGLQEVRYMGTGFLLIKRNVFERMIEKHGDEICYHPDSRPKETEWDFWSVGPYQDSEGFRRYLSEDWYFCQRWLDMGGKVYGDVKVIAKHIGHAIYPLQSQLKEMQERQKRLRHAN